MPRLVLAFLLAIANCPAETVFVRSARTDALIEIDAAKPAAYRIPRSIYGTFLEHIGNSVYGGLWAQVLENPSFEEALWSARNLERILQRSPDLRRASAMGLPLPWEPLDYAQGWRYEPRWADAANSSRSLLLMALPGTETGVRQEVYLPVHRVREYRGSIWAKHVSGPRAIEVSLRGRNAREAVLARESVALSGTGWQRYEFRLVLGDGAPRPLEPADFAITLRDEARVLVDQVMVFPADAVDGMDPDMVAMSRALRTPLVRYGGNFTSGYHWRDGIGPIDKRVSMLNQAWGTPEYNHFGTDEFLRFCQLVGAEPQVCLNLGSGTPEEAAGWVRYINERAGNKQGLLWELGNELWGEGFQIGYPGLARVADRTRAFSEAVRAVDSRARLIVTGQDPDHFREWNAKQLALGPEVFDYLATHFVVGAGRVLRPDPPAGFVAEAAFALPIGLERKLREMKEQIDADPRARGRIRIAFTEWLFHAGDDSVPRFANMGGAICAAGMLNSLMRVADFTTVSNMTGLIEFGGIWKKRGRVYGVPAYWAFRMYSNADASTPVRTGVTGAAYDIKQGNVRIPDIADVPYLDVVAALNEGRTRLTLFVVNRDAMRDTPARIRVAGFRPAPEARTVTLRAASIYQPNDETQPEAVRPIERPLTAGAEFEHVFPRGSVTVLELRQ